MGRDGWGQIRNSASAGDQNSWPAHLSRGRWIPPSRDLAGSGSVTLPSVSLHGFQLVSSFPVLRSVLKSRKRGTIAPLVLSPPAPSATAAKSVSSLAVQEQVKTRKIDVSRYQLPSKCSNSNALLSVNYPHPHLPDRLIHFSLLFWTSLSACMIIGISLSLDLTLANHLHPHPHAHTSPTSRINHTHSNPKPTHRQCTLLLSVSAFFSFFSSSPIVAVVT